MLEEIRLTEEEKVMLLDELLDQITNSRSALQVIRNDDAIVSHSNTNRPISNPIFTYSVYGSDTTRRTQNNNLIQKVQQMHKLTQIVTGATHEGEPDVDEVNEFEREDGKFFRYFKNTVRCFRCKRIGHYNYACLDQYSCIYCLSGEHSTDRCPQRTVCYQCYQFGHVISECSAPPGAFCQDCKRKHAKVCCFLTKGIDQVKQMFNTDYLYNNQNIRCMRCFDYGHLICSKDKLQNKEIKDNY